tara:strand:- start:532 stop:759 length:228 start_codon:yes stop_codon:yes gene_type:complete
MAIFPIKLLEKKPLEPYVCGMCRKVSRKNKFSWKSWFTGDELLICRECAYRESYGTTGMKTAKKKRLLEEKEINQ